MIYICTHTDFEVPTQLNGDYTILTCKPLAGHYAIPVEVIEENFLTPMQYAYAEGYHIWHIWTHDVHPWIGINQYRKYFFDVPENTTVLPVPRKYNMHEQYASAHNINDLLQCEQIIDEYFPQYHCEYASLNLYHCNMFVMRWDDFDAYCKFVFGVLNIFNLKNNLKTDQDVFNFVASRYDQYAQKHDVKYQSRLQGYLFERLGTIFFNTHFKIEHRKIHFVSDKKTEY